MDVAVAIFNIGAGLGVLVAGLALAYLAWRLAPLIGESRALARDVRHLARLAEDELRPTLERAKSVTADVEVLAEDAAVRLDRLGDAVSALEDRVAVGPAQAAVVTSGAGHGWAGSVESAQTHEDAPDT